MTQPEPVTRCVTCGHGRDSHHTVAFLDERYPGQAPHRSGHCTSCCDPEDAASSVCSHDFKPKPTQGGRCDECEKAWVVTIQRTNGARIKLCADHAAARAEGKPVAFNLNVTGETK